MRVIGCISDVAKLHNIGPTVVTLHSNVIINVNFSSEFVSMF